MGLVAPQHVGSSRTRAWTRVPCIGRRIPNHCTNREAQPSSLWCHLFCVLLGDGQSGVATRGGTREAQGLLYSQVLERQSHHMLKSHMEGAPREQTQQATGELRETEREREREGEREPVSNCLYWRSSSRWVYKQKVPGILLVCLDVTRSQSEEGKKGNLWQGPTLSHWCIWSSG